VIKPLATLISFLGIGAIQKLLSRADALEITWPLPEDLDDGRLAAMFYPGSDPTSSSRYQVPDWTRVYQELKREDVTKPLQVLCMLKKSSQPAVPKNTGST